MVLIFAGSILVLFLVIRLSAFSPRRGMLALHSDAFGWIFLLRFDALRKSKKITNPIINSMLTFLTMCVHVFASINNLSFEQREFIIKFKIL